MRTENIKAWQELIGTDRNNKGQRAGTGTDMIVKGGRHRFCRRSWSRCRHSWPFCRQPGASFREKNILGDWLTTNSDLMLYVLSLWQEVFQTSDNNYLIILPPRLVVTNPQQFTISIDYYRIGWKIIFHHQITVPMSSPSPKGRYL